MKQTFFCISVLVFCLFPLVACSTENGGDPGTKDNKADQVAMSINTPFEEKEGSGGSEHSASKLSFSLTPTLGSGKLVCTVERAYLVNNIFDEGIPLDETEMCAIRVGRGKKAVVYGDVDTPNFVDEETGKVVDGAYIVAVELTVTNEDASTKHYLDLINLPLGVTPNPLDSEKAYVFRADFLYLYDTTRVNNEFDDYANAYYMWFTGCGQRQEARSAFYLPVGEITTMTIYYVLGEYGGNTLDNLALSGDFAAVGEVPDTLYPLTLDTGT